MKVSISPKYLSIKETNPSCKQPPKKILNYREAVGLKKSLTASCTHNLPFARKL